MTSRSFWALFLCVVLASCVGGKLINDQPDDSSGCGDTSSDTKNCGSCGTVCQTGQTCSGGHCTSPSVMCSGVAVNVLTDPANCGDCANVCGASQQCSGGKCTCGGTQSACGKTCVDLQTDNSNCGVCIKACTTGEACSAGMCACTGGQTSCNSSCVNTSSDSANCGTCGNACTGGQLCNGAGACSTTCAGTAVMCTATAGPTCANLMTDLNNCGTCGNACAAGQTCTAGACVCTPTPGTMQNFCGGKCVDTLTDSVNCGSCGNPCTGGRSCVAGQCGCPAGQTFCDPTCVDLTAPATCGTDCSTKVACASGQTCSNGSCMGGTGGAGGSGGSGGGTGGAGAGGTGGATGGSGGDRPTTCPPVANVIADFEEAQVRADKGAIVTAQQGRQGWWYTSADTTTGYTPASVTSGPVLAASLTGDSAMTACNQFAFHATATGHSTWGAVSGTPFAAILPPPANPMTQKTKNPFDVSAFSGISMKMKLGSGSSPVLVELQQVETSATPDGSGMNNSVDLYNTRSKLLAPADPKRPERPSLTTSWQTISIPFGTLSPRYLPGGCASGVVCEAPVFNPKSALGLQFGTYTQYPGNTPAAYDIWVDDVTLYTGDAGLATYTQTAGAAHMFPVDSATVGTCAKPTGATGKFLMDAYVRWKATYVVSGRVVSPEIDGGATVSEGIAYGMLISVFMNDKTLFDQLWSYWQAHAGTGGLMNWKYGANNGGVTGSGSAVDADEDAAFALLKADKQWTGYTTPASNLVKAIYANDVEASSGALKLGNSGTGGSSTTNLSYFAPAYYREFAKVDAGDNWTNVINTGYSYLAKQTGNNGLVPAWCMGSCGSPGSSVGGYTDATDYQYDSHRTPWRVGLDYCWNGTPNALTYVKATTNFFASIASGNGIGSILDIYTPSGGKCPTTNCTETSQPNSMSCIGSAGVGAMAASNAKFLNSAWHFVLDASYTSDPQAQTAYTYYNATVGLLTALTMSGNFNNF